MKPKVTQGDFKQLNWGGKRKGAGRKRKGARRVSHAKRPEFSARCPLLVTVRFIEGLPSLRDFATLEVFAQVVRGANRREDFRIVEFSLQSNHAHLIVEAQGRVALSRAMNGFGRSLVHGLQVSLRHAGHVYADRYHARALGTPTEVRHGLGYTLKNGNRHGAWELDEPDPFSSGAQFDGWGEAAGSSSRGSRWLPRARTWLLAVGWRRLGLLSLRAAAARGVRTPVRCASTEVRADL
jgi:REP element-mobilizing transposase RayT